MRVTSLPPQLARPPEKKSPGRAPARSGRGGTPGDGSSEQAVRRAFIVIASTNQW